MPVRLVTTTLLFVSTTVTLLQNTPAQLYQLFVAPPTIPPPSHLRTHDRKEETVNHRQSALISQTETVVKAKTGGSTPLPTVKWPQTDNRIQRAIMEGERFGPKITKTFLRNGVNYYTVNGTDYEAPAEKLATVVSMFYDLSEVNKGKKNAGKRQAKSGRHSKNKYLKWMSDFLTCTDPMIFFCEPGSSWCDVVREKRQHAPTILAYLPFSEMTMNTNFDDSFWIEKALEKDQNRVPYVKKRLTSTYKVWNEKIILTHEASLANPFETEQFYWIDSGYFRDEEMEWPANWPKEQGPNREGGAVNGVIIRNDVTKNGVRSDQVVFQNAEPAEKGFSLAGGAWGGTAKGIANIYDHYWKTFWYMAENDNIWCIGYEQHIFTHMCKSFPDICNIQHHLEWRQMGEVMLRDPNFNFSANPFTLDPNCDHLIGDQDGANLKRKQPLVSGNLVFPRNFPVHSQRPVNVRPPAARPPATKKARPAPKKSRPATKKVAEA